MSPDEARSDDPVTSLRALGETLASTASLPHLARLIAGRIRDATGARRVAFLARDHGGQLRPAADSIATEDGGDVLALPLLARGDVEGIIVVQGAGGRSVLDAFVAQAAWAVAAVRGAEGGSGEAAAARARITGQVLHEVNNRLGAIQIYAYLIAERMRRGEDASGAEVAGKLCSAVERLGSSLAGLAPSNGSGSGGRSAADLESLLDACLGTVGNELAERGVRVVRERGAAGSVLVHEPTMLEGLRQLLRRLGGLAGAGTRIAVSTQRLSPHVAAIDVDTAVGMRCISGVLFVGDADELGAALLRDVIERQAAAVSVKGTAEDGALIRVELGGAG